MDAAIFGKICRNTPELPGNLGRCDLYDPGCIRRYVGSTKAISNCILKFRTEYAYSGYFVEEGMQPDATGFAVETVPEGVFVVGSTALL